MRNHWAWLVAAALAAGAPAAPRAVPAPSGAAQRGEDPARRSVPSSGSEGSVSDYATAREAGGSALTSQSGGITRGGGPNTQSSGQSGSAIYPY
jgi:hypothetical protein